MPLETRPAVYFFRDEVMKGEWNPAMTAGAGFLHNSAQL
jgi:hypothetical protein